MFPSLLISLRSVLADKVLTCLPLDTVRKRWFVVGCSACQSNFSFLLMQALLKTYMPLLHILASSPTQPAVDLVSIRVAVITGVLGYCLGEGFI